MFGESKDEEFRLPEEANIVIGGLVDRNRHKGVTHARQKEKGVPTYRLPLDQVVLKSAKVLTCNQVVQMLCCYLENGTWDTNVIPKRKQKH